MKAHHVLHYGTILVLELLCDIHVHVVVPHYVLCITWQEFLINKRSAVGVFYAVLAKSFDKTI